MFLSSSVWMIPVDNSGEKTKTKIGGWVNLLLCLTFLRPCIINIIANDDQQDATVLVHLFIPNQRYRFRAMSSPIIRSK
jgi:hypothetical protein